MVLVNLKERLKESRIQRNYILARNAEDVKERHNYCLNPLLLVLNKESAFINILSLSQPEGEWVLYPRQNIHITEYHSGDSEERTTSWVGARERLNAK
jgi:hypothetical protein